MPSRRPGARSRCPRRARARPSARAPPRCPSRSAAARRSGSRRCCRTGARGTPPRPPATRSNIAIRSSTWTTVAQLKENGLFCPGHRGIRDVDVVDEDLLAQLGGDERLPVAVDVGEAIDEAGRVVEVDEARRAERLGRVVEHRDRLARRAEVDALARDLDVVRRVDGVPARSRARPRPSSPRRARAGRAGGRRRRACSPPGARSGGSRGSARRSRSARARRVRSRGCARCPAPTAAGTFRPRGRARRPPGRLPPPRRSRACRDRGGHAARPLSAA